MSSGFVDPSAESAVIGTIETGLFDRISESKLIPAKAFTDDRWRIIMQHALCVEPEFPFAPNALAT